MTPDGIPKQCYGFFVEDMEGETLLYRLGGHKAIHLNQTAAVIWKLCDGTRSVREIADVLRTEYPEAAGVIDADVLSAIEQLNAEGAVLDANGGA